MKRSAVPTVVLFAALAVVALLVYGVVQSQTGASRTLDDQVNAGDYPLAPHSSTLLPVLGSGTAKQSLADYRGKVVVLNFWASWCDPCKHEAPLLRSTEAQLKASGKGTVLGATYQDAPDDSAAKLKQWGLDYPNVRDVDTTFAHTYGTAQIPETFVISPQGRIVAISRGIVDRKFMANALARAERS